MKTIKQKTAEVKKKTSAKKSATKASIIFPRACRLLKDMSDDEFARICECMQVQELHLKNKETFIHETDLCNRIGIVVIGAVRLTRQRLDGGRVMLETIGENGVFGMTYVFRDVKTMGISISAVGDTVVLLFNTDKIPHPCHKVCSAHLLFIKNLLAVMSQTTFQLKQRLRILSQHTIRGRLSVFLQIYAKRMHSNSFDIPYNRQALADLLCVERSALSAEISKLRNEHKLEVEKNHFKILG